MKNYPVGIIKNFINMLYGMKNDEVALIPKIKELYATD